MKFQLAVASKSFGHLVKEVCQPFILEKFLRMFGVASLTTNSVILREAWMMLFWGGKSVIVRLLEYQIRMQNNTLIISFGSSRLLLFNLLVMTNV
jgi:hypothetical protein